MTRQTARLLCLMVIVVGIMDVSQKWNSLTLWASQSVVEAQVSEDESPYGQIVSASREMGCEVDLMVALQQSECDLLDVNSCVSSAGALGPFQFLPTTWTIYAEPGWDIWSYEDAGRAACKMVRALEIDTQPTKEEFALRFSGLDGGLCWNCYEDGYYQALGIWEVWKNTDE